MFRSEEMSFTSVEGMRIGFGAPLAGAWATPGFYGP
jgi:hypothetical protein